MTAKLQNINCSLAFVFYGHWFQIMLPTQQDQREPVSSGKKASFTYPANEVNFIFKYPCCAVESVSATTYVFDVAVAIPTKP